MPGVLYAPGMDGDSTQRARTLLQQKREGAWYAGGLRFACRFPECCDCCSGKRGPGYVWVSRDEMATIAAHLGIGFDLFQAAYTRPVDSRFSLVEKPNEDCIFLGDGGCSIYAVRPAQCRTYPFWEENLRNRAAWRLEAAHCPGIHDNAEPVPADEVERRLGEDIAWRRRHEP